MLPIVPAVDDELAVIQLLRGSSRIVAPIGTALPAQWDKSVFVIVTSGAGLQITWGIDEPVVQVDVCGGTKKACKDTALLVRAIILSAANDIVPAGTVVSASELVRPQWLPDEVEVPPTPRYTARYSVITHIAI